MTAKASEKKDLPKKDLAKKKDPVKKDQPKKEVAKKDKSKKDQPMKDKSVAELSTLVTDKLREQFNLRVQRAAGQPVKSHLFKIARRDIARAKTILASKGGK